MDVQALLATLKTEREKLTRAIMALEELSTSSPVRAATKAWTKHPATTKAAIAARMRAVHDAEGALAQEARTLSAHYGIPFQSINGNWRTWEQKANGATTAFTADETAQAANVAQA